MQANRGGKEPVNIYDCISEFFKTDTLDVQNKLFCQNCQNLSIAQMRFRITHLPRILIIHLKRFSYNSAKLRNPVNFDEEIQIDAEYMNIDTKKMSSEQMAREFNHVYHLYAIIVHEGYSTANGHYYSFIKNQASGIWYKYDDDEVKSVGPSLASVKKQMQNAYILFYKKNYMDCAEQKCEHQHPGSKEISAISRSRSPSFFRQIVRENSKHVDLFEKVTPSNDQLI